jgi:hypothetical protein
VTRDPHDRCAVSLRDPVGLETYEEVRCVLRAHDPVLEHVLLVPEGSKHAAVFRWSGGGEPPARVAFLARAGAVVAPPEAPAPAGRARGRKERPSPQQRKDAQAQGYSGDPCDACGALKLRRKGMCLGCDFCGASTGCS